MKRSAMAFTVGLSLSLCTVADARIGEVTRAFSRPGVQFVVLRFAESDCKQCTTDERAWASLDVDLKRLWIIEVADDKRCQKTPAFVDQSVCRDAAQIRRDFKVQPKERALFLWDAWGTIHEIGSATDIAKHMTNPKRPPLSIVAPPDLRPALLRAIAKDALYQPARGLAPRSNQPLCKTAVGPGPYALEAQPAGDKVKLQLHRGNCSRAAIVVDKVDAPSAAVVMTRAQRPDAMPSSSLALQQKAVRSDVPQAPEARDQPPVVSEHGTPAERLLSFAHAWKGVRFQRGGFDHRGIDDTRLARLAMQRSFGIDIGDHLKKQIESGPEVQFDKRNPDRALQPGDLLFYVSYAYLPRSVMVYLGGGKILTSQLIRGVQIDSVPSSVPDYLYLVARRPMQGFTQDLPQQ